MMNLASRCIRRTNDRLQQCFGVRLQRPVKLDKHAYRDIAGMRKWSSGDIIFDVGANDGRSIFRMREYLPAARILAFEPVSTTFGVLTERTKQFANVERIKAAIGSTPGEAEIYLQPLDVMNSFDPSWGDPIGSEVVAVTTVDDVMATRGIDYVHFLKVDTEGFEMEVLKGATKALARGAIGIIQLEVGLDARVRGGAALREFQDHLAPMGYFLKGIYNQCHGAPSDNGLADLPSGLAQSVLSYCDAVFVSASPEPALDRVARRNDELPQSADVELPPRTA